MRKFIEINADFTQERPCRNIAALIEFERFDVWLLNEFGLANNNALFCRVICDG
ncbi:hypothetical protein B4090_4728 [Bacillus licheniformis]|nr:hypothetical protein B4090_4728 [Bacillus licheniformis]